MRKRPPTRWQVWAAVLAFSFVSLRATGCGGNENPAPQPNLTTPPVSSTGSSSALPTSVPTLVNPPSPAPSPLPPAASTADMAARVNGAPVSLADFNRQVAAAEAYLRSQNTDLNSADGREQLKQLREQVLDELIEQVLIDQAASEMGIRLSDAELDANLQKTINESGGQAQFERWLAQNNMSADDFRRSLRSNLLGAQLREKVIASVPARGEQIRVRHILLDDRQKAEQLLARLKAGADFAVLARQNSLDQSTRDSGGDLGWIPHGLTSPEFEKAAFALGKGQLSGVVQSPFGFHIIQVLERDPNRALTSDMQLAVREAAFTQWLEALKAKAKVERFVE